MRHEPIARLFSVFENYVSIKQLKKNSNMVKFNISQLIGKKSFTSVGWELGKEK